MREPVKTNLVVKDCPYRKRGDKCIHSQVIKVRKYTHNWPTARIKAKHYLRIEEYCHLQVRIKLAGVSIRECYVKKSAKGFDNTYRELTIKDLIRVK